MESPDPPWPPESLDPPWPLRRSGGLKGPGTWTGGLQGGNVRLRFPVSCVFVPIFGFPVIISSLVPVCV